MRFFSLLLILCFAAEQALAGKITGRVSDETTGEPIIGATVLIRETSNGTATDINGSFSLATLSGVYSLEIKYLGYQTKQIAGIQVNDNETVSLNIILSETSATQLNEVVVRSSLKKENISALYILQKNAIAVTSGISADVIQRSPDRNTGEVLKRVSGASVKDNKFVIVRGLSDRYNLAMINNALMPGTEPDRKAFSFDVIPSNLIDNIIISKTASPDLPGDFAGGMIQVQTRDVPDKNFLSVGISAGYNSQSTFREFVSNQRTVTDFLGFHGDNDALPSTFGKDYVAYKSMTPKQRSFAAGSLSNNFPEVRSTASPISSVQIAGGNTKSFANGGKLGTIVGLSYRNAQAIVPGYERNIFEQTPQVIYSYRDDQYRYSAMLAGLANFSYVQNRSRISFKNLYNQLYDNTYYKRTGYNTNNYQDTRLYSAIPSDRKILSSQLEGEHSFGENKLKVNWNINYTLLKAAQHDLRTAYYNRNISLDSNHNPVVEDSLPFTLTDRNSRRYFIDLKDNTYGGNFSANYPFRFLGKKQTLKAGYTVLLKTRNFNARLFQHRLSGTHLEGFDKRPFDEMFRPENYHENGLELEEITNHSDRYNITAALHAGFVMFDNQLSDKFRLVWGLRYEHYRQTLNFSNSTGPFSRSNVFADMLPSVNISYHLNDDNKLRFAASRTVNRPEFREIAPFTFVDFENVWAVNGNPDLKRSNITNLDLRYEYYPAPGEVLTFGVFYKDFQNPIETIMDPQSNADQFYVNYRNAKSARSLGAELDLRKNLSFIADKQWLQNLTLATNITYIYSRVDLSLFDGIKDRPLQGQSPYIINVSAWYHNVKTGLAMGALYNRTGHRIVIVGNRDIPNYWENGRDVIDLQISKSILKNKGEIKFTLADLLNQPAVTYWNTNDKNTFQKGADLLGRGNDQVIQRYSLGTTYTLGFTYRF